MTVLEEGGRQALTHYRTLAFDGKISLVSIILATGRTHQIRVHMKHHGTPVLGDETYGVSSFNTKYGIDRQMLHAHRLKFQHPILDTQLEFEAELPADMKLMVKNLQSRNLQ